MRNENIKKQNLLVALKKYIEDTENIFSPVSYKIDTKDNKRYEVTILISTAE